MNLFKTFENRMNEAFGAGPQGYAAPFSFKKLAKRASREMENETYLIDGSNTAPALYTILVSSADDAMMRPLYTRLTEEIVKFVEAKAESKGYVFVGRPLVRFMVDPGLRSGRFAVFAENIDVATLNRLRVEEEAFLSSSTGLGGAAAELAQPLRPLVSSHANHGSPRVVTPVEKPAGPPAPVPDDDEDALTHEEFAPAIDDLSADESAGLSVIPQDFDEAVAEVPQVPQVVPVPPTQRRDSPGARQATRHACTLTDQSTGTTYTVGEAGAVIGRERTSGGVVLRDPNVSRRHAQISFDGASWHITDLNSTNGTMVNNVEVASAVLKNGDLVTLGLVNLVFREERA